MTLRYVRALFLIGAFLFTVIVAAWGPNARAQELPEPGDDPVLRGSKAIWDAIVINNTETCWKDVREAIDSALEKLPADEKKIYYDASYNGWVNYLPSLPVGGAAEKRLKAAEFKNDPEIYTLSYDIKLEGKDEELFVDIIESKVSERDVTGGKAVLRHSFTIVHGDSLCGATEGKPEDATYFAKFTVWWDGYFDYTEFKKDETANVNAAWAKQLKKTFSNEGGVDLITCCKLTEHKTTQTQPKPSPETPKHQTPPTPETPKRPPTPTPAPATPPLDKDKNHTPVQPKPGTGGGSDGGVYLPPIGGARSLYVGTVSDPNTGSTGPTSYIVGVVEPNGKKTFWQGLTDENGHFKFKLPAITVASITLFRFFDKNGEPDKGAQCDVGAPHVPGTDQLANVPAAQQPAVLGGSSSFQRGGGGHGVFELETRGNDPLTTRVLVDGSTDGVKVLAASDRSVSAQLDDNLPLGRHTFAIESGGKRSNTFVADVLELVGDPIPPQEVGSLNTVRVHVIGLPPGDTATMAFQVGGAATLANGGSEIVVPVKNDEANIQIRGIRRGQSLVRFKLDVAIPGYWPAH
jgi:hypothetical protein